MAAVSGSSFVPPPEWEVYKRAPGFVLGFHGCDRLVGLEVIEGRKRHLTPSTNDYDWLGSGVYFWEADPWRALAFAQTCKCNGYSTRGKVTDPFVVGAVIDLGHCCNLFEAHALAEVKRAHDYLESVYTVVHGKPMPQNRGRELGMRFLDKAVMDAVHKLRSRRGMPEYSSVRSPFVEGEKLYQGAGFRAKNHMQIAVRDVSCIRGYFRLPGL